MTPAPVALRVMLFPEVTIPLTVLSFAIGLVLALFVALARISAYKALSGLARAFISIIRGTPLLLQLFIVFYGLPQLGLNDAARAEITSSTNEVWHCAASLSFQQEDRAEIFRMNVDGTRNVLDLVREIPGRRLHHVSTAYIAGNRSDLALETEIDIGQSFRNPYEESKCRAELMIADAHKAGNITASVYRPSIVIGDSKSGRVTHFHGVYAFIRALWTVLERLRRRMPESGFINLPLRVLGRDDASYRNEVVELLQWVGLGERMWALPPVLSGGEKQRAAIARAVIARPQLLLADEPTGNVDPVLARRLLRLFVELNKSGTSVVIATHDIALMDLLDARRLVLHEGRMHVYD